MGRVNENPRESLLRLVLRAQKWGPSVSRIAWGYFNGRIVSNLLSRGRERDDYTGFDPQEARITYYLMKLASIFYPLGYTSETGPDEAEQVVEAIIKAARYAARVEPRIDRLNCEVLVVGAICALTYGRNERELDSNNRKACQLARELMSM